jgi:uncharacterized protein YcfJ
MSMPRNVKTALVVAALGLGLAFQAAAPANALTLHRLSGIGAPAHPGGGGSGHWGGWGRWGGRGAAFAAGAMVGAAMANAAAAPAPEAVEYDSFHVRRCLAHYRTYDPATDTYLGYDMQRHYCQL